MNFNPENYTVEELTLEGRTIRFRAFRSIVYCENPVLPEYQRLSVFAPEVYYEGGSINGYDLHTAPVLVPNDVGGYFPGELGEPGIGHMGPVERINTLFEGLYHGCVVVSVAVRGRIQKAEDGRNIGKAPALIVDHKAAIRWLRAHREQLPGDYDRIITSGTSAGGALSALAGACCDHPDYEPLLEAIGAEKGSDAIFAANCYCPIIDLEHADMAYEWEFDGVYDYKRMKMVMSEGGRPNFTPVDGTMTEEEQQVSRELAAAYPAYINHLELKAEDGTPLTLKPDGTGSFRDYVESVILASAQSELDRGESLADQRWLTVENGRAAAMDLRAYAEQITRMKSAPAFDALDCTSGENDLFGTETVNESHFSRYVLSRTGKKAESLEAVKLVNPMRFVRDPAAATAKHWRIRHGEIDRDTALSVSAAFAALLRMEGCEVDYASPWNTPHGGDYDLPELFAWIDGLCKN